MQDLVDNWEQIAEEGVRIKNQIPVSDICRARDWTQYDLKSDICKHWIRGWTNKDTWLNFGLIYNGQIIDYALEVAPKTLEILKRLQNSYKISIAGYSWLKPKSGIPPHTDVNIETTYHLGLQVPDKCILISDRKIYKHENGKLFGFDSNKTHSAVNGSGEDRLILYLLAAPKWKL